MSFANLNDKTLYFSCSVTPNASKNEIVGVAGESLKIKIQAKAERGEANKELVQFLSKWLRIPQKNILILRGKNARLKLLKIEPCLNMPEPLQKILSEGR